MGSRLSSRSMVASDCLRRLWSEAYVTRGLDDATHRSAAMGHVLLSVQSRDRKYVGAKSVPQVRGSVIVVHGDSAPSFVMGGATVAQGLPYEPYSARRDAAKRFVRGNAPMERSGSVFLFYGDSSVARDAKGETRDSRSPWSPCTGCFSEILT